MRRKLLSLLLLLLSLPALAQLPSEGVYKISSSESDIHWRTYRAGILSLVGHNHVISASRISGSVRVAGKLEDSQFTLEIPVAALVVDSPALRSRYGGDFAKQPSAEAIAGTRENMLSAALLNGSSFPTVRISGNPAGESVMQVNLELLGRRIPLQLPVQLTFGENSLRARGSFTLSHQQLGLTPSRAMGGALRVADNIDFSYDIRAKRTP